MKQIEYTEKQKVVLEVLEQVDKYFKPNYYAASYLRESYLSKITAIKAYYGIKEQYETLREYINNHSCGSYHYFNFTFGDIKVSVIDVLEFEQYYNSLILDKYYVLKDDAIDNGGNCENYRCDHNLEIVRKDE